MVFILRDGLLAVRAPNRARSAAVPAVARGLGVLRRVWRGAGGRLPARRSSRCGKIAALWGLLAHGRRVSGRRCGPGESASWSVGCKSMPFRLPAPPQCARPGPRPAALRRSSPVLQVEFSPPRDRRTMIWARGGFLSSPVAPAPFTHDAPRTRHFRRLSTKRQERFPRPHESLFPDPS